MFRFKKGIEVPYARQGYIYFVSRMYKQLPAEKQEKIRELCREHGRGNAEALMEFVTTDATALEICRHHFIASWTTLYRAVKRYYENFPEYL